MFWCAAEIAWIGGQSHGVYGPLACGATAVMSEGTLDVPTRSRAWEIIERYGVNSLVTTPSAVRNLRQWVDTPPARADLSSLRLIVTLGERIDFETRNWLDFEVGGGRALIANAWGQTELAGLVTVTTTPTESSGAPEPPVPDPGLEVFDTDGQPVRRVTAGELVLLHPWPGAFLQAEGSPAPADSWWSPYPGAYATGDEARREDDGRLTVLGRRDPVVSISGQQVSLTEVAQILEEHPLLGAVDVIAVFDERRGQALCACVVLDEKAEAGEPLARELCSYVHDALGGLARPRTVAFVEAFPPELTPDVRRRALRLLCTANPAEWFTVTAAQLAAAAAPPPPPSDRHRVIATGDQWEILLKAPSHDDDIVSARSFRGSSVAERAPVKRLVGSSNLPPGAKKRAGQGLFRRWPVSRFRGRSRVHPASIPRTKSAGPLSTGPSDHAACIGSWVAVCAESLLPRGVHSVMMRS